MRAFAICAVLAACGGHEPPSSPHGPAAAGATAPAQVAPTPRIAPSDPAGPDASSPGLRLPDGAAPVSYDLTLELDPAREIFTGHVEIEIAVAAAGTTRLWLHAVDLEIAGAKLADHGRMEDVEVLEAGAGSQLRGFALPHPVGGETITLAIDYTGHASDLSGRTGKDEEGLFRERAGGRWYLYSQSESIFARKIVPCFDEPRWKPAWRVTAIIPRGQVALANAPAIGERELSDGRREFRFAEIARLPSYLLAVAVGPFDLVEAGKLGRAHIPVRIAVPAGDGRRVGRARRELPKVIDALERYLDAPLPLSKLDLVAVPQFFGAMENVGLITFETTVLVGGRELVTVMAHELAHQWFGNSVTPAWWDHLWLSEAFATWLGERVAASLGAALPPELAHRARAEALSADEQRDARSLVHPIASSDEIEPAFDAIAYEKGAAVLAAFERFAGSAAFQTAVRGYVAAHAGASVTSQAFLDALAAATDPATAAALASNLAHAGTPVVELVLRCSAQPAIGEAEARGVGTPTAMPAGRGSSPVGSLGEAEARGVGTPTAMPAGRGSSPVGSLIATARDGVTIPVCVRFPVVATAAIETARACFLAGAYVEYSLPAAAGCPAWVVGNDGGRGYYRTVWRPVAPAAPLERLSPDERLARGDDAALAVRRGELALVDALGELTALAMTRDPYGELAALAIARAIDPLVPDPARPVWATWLAGRFADRMTSTALSAPRSVIDDVLRRQVVELALGAIDPATLAAVRAASERHASGAGDLMLRVAAARDARALLDRMVDAAAAAKTEEARGELLDDLGAFPAAYAPRIVDVALDPRFAAAQVWPALAAMLERGDTRTAAWRAIHAQVARLLGALPAARARDVVAATAALCDATMRAEVVADFTPRLAAIGDGKRVLGRTLAEIDRCIARRAGAGDVAHALAATPMPPRPATRPARPGALTPRP